VGRKQRPRLSYSSTQKQPHEQQHDDDDDDGDDDDDDQEASKQAATRNSVAQGYVQANLITDTRIGIGRQNHNRCRLRKEATHHPPTH